MLHLWRKRNTVGTRSGNLFTLLSCSIQYVIDGKTCTTYFVALQEKYMHELAGQIYFLTYKMQWKWNKLSYFFDFCLPVLWLIACGVVSPCLLHFTPLKSGYVQIQTPVEWRIEHMEYSCRKWLKYKTQTNTTEPCLFSLWFRWFSQRTAPQ